MFYFFQRHIVFLERSQFFHRAAPHCLRKNKGPSDRLGPSWSEEGTLAEWGFSSSATTSEGSLVSWLKYAKRVQTI
jgi:hypothetical protein